MRYKYEAFFHEIKNSWHQQVTAFIFSNSASWKPSVWACFIPQFCPLKVLYNFQRKWTNFYTYLKILHIYINYYKYKYTFIEIILIILNKLLRLLNWKGNQFTWFIELKIFRKGSLNIDIKVENERKELILCSDLFRNCSSVAP